MRKRPSRIFCASDCPDARLRSGGAAMWMRRLARSAVVFLLVLGSTGLFSGCSGSRATSITTELEGVVTVRGNVPFNAPILETESRNLYVLVLDDEQRGRLSTPGRYRVFGRIYLGDWNGKAYAHLDVSRLVLVE